MKILASHWIRAGLHISPSKRGFSSRGKFTPRWQIQLTDAWHLCFLTWPEFTRGNPTAKVPPRKNTQCLPVIKIIPGCAASVLPLSTKLRLVPIVASATVWCFHSRTWFTFCLQPQGAHVFILSTHFLSPFLPLPYSLFFLSLIFLFLLLPELFFLLSLKHFFFSDFYEQKWCLLWAWTALDAQSLLFMKLTDLMCLPCLF